MIRLVGPKARRERSTLLLAGQAGCLALCMVLLGGCEKSRDDLPVAPPRDAQTSRPYVEKHSTAGKVKLKGVVSNDGKFNGPFEEYDESGTLLSTYTYKNDLKDGTFRQLHPNGAVALEGQLNQGIKEGWFLHRAPDGAFVGAECFIMGLSALRTEEFQVTQTTPCELTEGEEKVATDGPSSAPSSATTPNVTDLSGRAP